MSKPVAKQLFQACDRREAVGPQKVFWQGDFGTASCGICGIRVAETGRNPGLRILLQPGAPFDNAMPVWHAVLVRNPVRACPCGATKEALMPNGSTSDPVVTSAIQGQRRKCYARLLACPNVSRDQR
jgi:hypothetical protein